MIDYISTYLFNTYGIAAHTGVVNMSNEYRCLIIATDETLIYISCSLVIQGNLGNDAGEWIIFIGSAPFIIPPRRKAHLSLTGYIHSTKDKGIYYDRYVDD